MTVQDVIDLCANGLGFIALAADVQFQDMLNLCIQATLTFFNKQVR